MVIGQVELPTFHFFLVDDLPDCSGHKPFSQHNHLHCFWWTHSSQVPERKLRTSARHPIGNKNLQKYLDFFLSEICLSREQTLNFNCP